MIGFLSGNAPQQWNGSYNGIGGAGNFFMNPASQAWMNSLNSPTPAFDLGANPFAMSPEQQQALDASLAKTPINIVPANSGLEGASMLKLATPQEPVAPSAPVAPPMSSDEWNPSLQAFPQYKRVVNGYDNEGNELASFEITGYTDQSGNKVDDNLVKSAYRDSGENTTMGYMFSGAPTPPPVAPPPAPLAPPPEPVLQAPLAPEPVAPPPPPPPPVVTPEPPPPPPPAPVAAPPVEAPVAAPATPTVPEPPVLPSSDIQPATPVAPTTTASPTMATATTSNIDPTIQPYLSYGLSEAQKLYQGGGPQYYGGQTYVSPSQQTQTGLQALEQRASQGSPLTGAAQSQLQGTIQGNYLSGNPFFQGAFNPAAQAAESKFKDTLGSIGSAASKAGRYGSGAMSTMQQGASGQFAKTLADTAGTLAYQNYSDERGRQQAATMAAPAMAQSDYADIQNMLKAGQMREGYTGAQQQADIDKFNFQQTQPQQNLANFLGGVYGNPLGRAQQGGAATSSPSGWQNLLGGAATAAGIYKNIGGAQGVSQIGNWLTGGGGGGNAYNAATQYAATSPTGWLDF
jgi:hypothetical protein